MFETELRTAISLANTAGDAIMQFYRDGFAAEEKIGSDNFAEPVTVADRTASRLIVEGLAERFPDDGILSEEEPDTLTRLEKERVWIIDPLDGTKGFIEKNGDFAVQIGLAEHGRSVLGVVYLPFFDEMYFAASGSGAFLKRGDNSRILLKGSDKIDFKTMSLAVSRHHPSPRMRQVIEAFGFRKLVRRGSVGLKIGLIAKQECDMYIHFSPRTKHWDTCAPEAIINEAGGRLTDIFGDTIIYNTADVQNHNGVLASCGEDAHRKAVNELTQPLQEFGRVKVQTG